MLRPYEPCSSVFKETSGRVIPKVSLCPTLATSYTDPQYIALRMEENPKLYFCELKCYLGSLHMRAKSRDHDIVRAQNKVSKGCPNTPPKPFSVVTDPQV